MKNYNWICLEYEFNRETQKYEVMFVGELDGQSASVPLIIEQGQNATSVLDDLQEALVKFNEQTTSPE